MTKMICPKADKCSGYICNKKHKIPHEFEKPYECDIGCEGYDSMCPACIEVEQPPEVKKDAKRYA